MRFTKKDFRVDWYSGTGAGGQHRNKHRNCCRITHSATGLSATAQSHRERPANQREAFVRLAGKLTAYYGDPEPARRQANNVVRTYHFERGIVSDGVVQLSVESVMDGALEEFLSNALQGNRPARRTGRM